MRRIVYFLLLLIIYSCNFISNGINVSVINNSDKIIKNVKCYTSQNKEGITFASLKPSEEMDDYLSIKNNKTDGHYILEFTNEKGETIKHTDGYYTNGKPLSNRIIFEIQNDTLIYSTK